MSIRTKPEGGVHGRACRATALGITVLLCGPLTAEVRIQGLSDELLANARAHLRLDDEPCEAPDWRVRRLVKEGRGEIRTALEALGYYESVVNGSLETGEQCWTATFVVDPGEPVLVREMDVQVNFDGESDEGFDALIRNAPLKAGKPFRHDQYEDLKRTLLQRADRRGYADAAFETQRVSVFERQRAADVELRFEAGRRYSFGPVSFEQDTLDEALLRRYVPFRQGEPYDGRALSDLYAALAGSGFFSNVQVEPLTEERGEFEIPIRVSLSASPRQLYTVGAGFSTNTGPRGRAGYTNRRINRRGHQWGASVLLSSVVSELAANYRLPLGDPRSEWLSLETGLRHEDTETSESDAYQASIRRVKERGGGWQESQFIDFLIEDFKVGLQRDTSRLVIPGISWQRTQTENRFRPRRGSRLYAEIRTSADALGSDASFVRVEGSAKWIRGVGARGRLILKGELGASVTDRFSALPPSLRFFAGGDSSLRGYEFESLGPTDEMGIVIGGNGKAIASVEYEHDLVGNWSLATFVDSGNAFDDFDLEPKTGIGVGVRWQSPVGPIRLDLAKPMNNGDRSLRFHLTFGPDL